MFYVWTRYLSKEIEDVTVDVEVEVEVDINAKVINLETSCNFRVSLAYTQDSANRHLHYFAILTYTVSLSNQLGMSFKNRNDYKSPTQRSRGRFSCNAHIKSRVHKSTPLSVSPTPPPSSF